MSGSQNEYRDCVLLQLISYESGSLCNLLTHGAIIEQMNHFTLVVIDTNEEYKCRVSVKKPRENILE